MPKAINISADQAREITELPNNTVLISINNTDGDLHKLQLDRDSSKILTVRFDDISSAWPTRLVNGHILNPLTRDIALKILDFININKGKDVIVHCHAGIARSSAVCLYLNLIEDYDLKPDFWAYSNPNEFVLGLLIKERKRK